MAQPSTHLLASSPQLHYSQSEELAGRSDVRRRIVRVAATGAVVLIATRTVVMARPHRRF